MASKRYIEASWQNYRRLAVPLGLPEPFIAQLEQAYKVGAALLFEIMTKGVSADPDIQPGEIAFMQAVAQELADIGEAVDDALLRPARPH